MRRTSPTTCRAICRHILASDWYSGLFPTRLSPQPAAMLEFNGKRHGRCCAARPAVDAHAFLAGIERYV
jgi:hypothetical protein